MLEPLASRFDVSFIDAIGIQSIRQPVYGVGHSLGGYLNYLAAVRRPELFRAIVLLDAPIIGPFRGAAARSIVQALEALDASPRAS